MTKTNERERDAIRTVMRDVGVPVSYMEISSRAGQRLAGPLMEMVLEGEVIRTDPVGDDPALYRLARIATCAGTTF